MPIMLEMERPRAVPPTPGMAQARSVSRLADSDEFTLSVQHDRNWTWVKFHMAEEGSRPSQATREAMTRQSARWSGKRQLWYFPYYLTLEQVQEIVDSARL